jgi:ABC-type multidrug transport system fused ATPase/permease subunit
LRNYLRQLLSLLSRGEKRGLAVLVAINAIAALIEVVGVFSILPFLAVAGDPSVVDRQPLLRGIREWSGLESHGEFILAAGVFTIVAIVATNAFGMLSLWYRTRYCYRVLAAMSGRLFRAYLTQPYVFFLRRNSAVLGKDLLNEVWGFFSNALEPVTCVVARGLSLVFVVTALFIYDWLAACVVFVVLGGFYGVVHTLFQHRLSALGRMRWDANERRYRLVAEALGGLKEVRLFGRERWYAGEFSRESDTVARASGRSFLYGISPRYLLESLAFTLLVGVVLAVLLRDRPLSEILPLLGLYAVAGVRLMPALQIVYQYLTAIRTNTGAVYGLARLFEETGANRVAAEIPGESFSTLRLTGELLVDDIRFTYSGAERPVLSGVSLRIPARSCVGITGPSGSGKTTLMDVLLGLLEPDSGSLSVDGLPLDAGSRRAWHRNVGFVPQQIYLVDGTVAENIAFGIPRERVDAAAIERAARTASLHDFITGLPEGYRTSVGERGIRLSGGQRQRLAIARALYHDPDVLFFDEATSALDAETENAIVESIQSLAHRKTIVIIAHRLSTLRYCDMIFTLDSGFVKGACAFHELEK